MTPSLDLSTVIDLYRTYAEDLRRVRRYQRRLYRERCIPPHERNPITGLIRGLFRDPAAPDAELATMSPQFDDICAELTYLLVRHSRPRTAVEISPCGGWSTSWLLHGLRDNGLGRLHSYDLVDLAPNHVPAGLAKDRWVFHRVDITENASLLPSQIDYLFIDSDHSADFATWYTTEILEGLSPRTLVSVDDVFHSADPGSFGGEGRVVVDWLENRGIRYFTPAPEKDQSSYTWILREKAYLGLDKPIHGSTANTAIFFRT